MERVWLKHYPPGVPATIDPSQYASLISLFEESFEKFRGRAAYLSMGKSLTYGALDEMSLAFGAYLQSKGLKNYDPNQEQGDAFIFEKQNVWHAFGGIVRALETFRFPFDWRTIQRHGMEQIEKAS